MRLVSPSRRLVAALLAVAMTGAAAASIGAAPAEPAASREHRRPAEQTFLTYPEWFLVYSPAEYAEFVRDRDPSAFPFLGHVRQFWRSYRAIWRATRKDYPFNAGYHVMIVVIGVSTTAEYALRAVYETLVGRLAELARRHGFTAEDRYGAAVAQEYVDFIRVRPWYEFDFRAKLKGLWKECPVRGADRLRKWERRYALTSEYAAKAVYGWLIGKMTKIGYEEPLLVTAVLLDRLPDASSGWRAEAFPELKVLEARADGVLVTVPRYQAFTDYAAALARSGVELREVAGNRGSILLTTLAPLGWAPPESAGEVLFRQPISTQAGRERVALVTTVPGLAGALRALASGPVTVEHVYDY